MQAFLNKSIGKIIEHTYLYNVSWEDPRVDHELLQFSPNGTCAYEFGDATCVGKVSGIICLSLSVFLGLRRNNCFHVPASVT
jgi:hypothetical protein